MNLTPASSSDLPSEAIFTRVSESGTRLMHTAIFMRKFSGVRCKASVQVQDAKPQAVFGLKSAGKQTRRQRSGNRGLVAQSGSYGSANTKTAWPAATATCCRASSKNEIGLLSIAAPVWNCQTGVPVPAASAKKLPSFDPPKTRPPPVASRPPHGGD